MPKQLVDVALLFLCDLIMIRVGMFGLCVLFNTTCFAINLNDFVSNVIDPKQKVESRETNPAIAFQIPDASRKRNASAESAWYCDKVNNAYCYKQASSQVVTKVVTDGDALAPNSYTYQGANGQYVNRNSNNFDKNAIANFNITNSNQTALQSYSPKLNGASPEDKLINNVAIPIQADKNTNVSVGANQIQFNVSY